MIKKFLACSVCMAALIGPAYAGQAGTWYLRGDIGVGISDFAVWQDEVAVAAGAGFGYNYSEMFRTDVTFDGTFGYETNVFGIGADLDAYSVMVNGYMELLMGAGLKPYLGAGVGYGWAEVSALGLSADDDGVAIAGMAGISYDLSQDMTLDMGYKYRRIIIGGEDVGDHMIRAGLRLNIN